MSYFFPSFALLLLCSVVSSQEFPLTDCCCAYKYSPEEGMFNYYNQTPEVMHMHGCLDACLYVKEGTDDKYCFGPGNQQVRCEGSDSRE